MKNNGTRSFRFGAWLAANPGYRKVLAWTMMVALIVLALFGFVMMFRELLSGNWVKVLVVGTVAAIGGIRAGRSTYQTAKDRQITAQSRNG